jgi:hypothetical protein
MRVIRPFGLSPRKREARPVSGDTGGLVRTLESRPFLVYACIRVPCHPYTTDVSTLATPQPCGVRPYHMYTGLTLRTVRRTSDMRGRTIVRRYVTLSIQSCNRLVNPA